MTLTDRLVAHFETLEDELNALDAVAGDGDHGSTMLRGLRAAAAHPETAVAAFRTAAGGASGSLFAQVLAGLIAAEGGAAIGPSLDAAARRIAAIGQAKPGDRTMLDALIPAALAATPAEALAAAEVGAAATTTMSARRGRARYVEGAGLGHVDAGARSVVAMLRVFAEGEPA
jgi:phosphoenolpyruvate---glycerone phosphotransferase subunit DhaL